MLNVVYMKPYYYFYTFLAIPTCLFVANVVLAMHITRALVSRKACESKYLAIYIGEN